MRSVSFLSVTPDSLLKNAMSLLEILPDKDLRDTKEYVLSDHLRYSSNSVRTRGDIDEKLFHRDIFLIHELQMNSWWPGDTIF